MTLKLFFELAAALLHRKNELIWVSALPRTQGCVQRVVVAGRCSGSPCAGAEFAPGTPPWGPCVPPQHCFQPPRAGLVPGHDAPGSALKAPD